MRRFVISFPLLQQVLIGVCKRLARRGVLLLHDPPGQREHLGARRGYFVRLGHVRRIVVPDVAAGSIQTRPPLLSTCLRTIARPMPVVSSASCDCRVWNSCQTRAWCWGGMPTPLSSTANSQSSPRSTAEI